MQACIHFFKDLQHGFLVEARNPRVTGKSFVWISRFLTLLVHQYFSILSLCQKYKEPTCLNGPQV